MIQQTEFECLKLLELSCKDAAFLTSVKKNFMKRLKYPENLINMTINDDNFTLERWKNASIKKLLSRVQSSKYRNLHYRNWDEAIRYSKKYEWNNSGRL